MRWPLLALLALSALACEDRGALLDAPFDAAVEPAMPDAERALKPGEIRQPPGAPRSDKDLHKVKEAAEEGKQIEKKGAPPIKKLDAYRLKIGDVLVDRLNNELKVPCRVNMEEGILEYFACGKGGKLHESVLECMAHPSHIHVGALLLGMEPAKIWIDPERKQANKLAREGSLVRFYVESQGQPRRPAEDWLYNRATNASPPQNTWHFLGSAFWAQQYAADATQSMIGLVPDDSVIFESENFAGNPYQGMNEGYEVNKATIPKRGTPLTLIIEIARREGAEPTSLKAAPAKKAAPPAKPPAAAAVLKSKKESAPTPASQPTSQPAP